MKHRKKIKIWFSILVLGFFMSNELLAQALSTLDLQTCYQKAEQHYPLIRQYALLEQSESYSLDQIASGNFPQIRLGGQWSYQSEVTQIPFSLPDTEIPSLDKDQYKIYIDVAQPLSDLFTTQKRKKELIIKEAAVQTKTLDTEIYKLKERINQLYFGVLLIDRQIAQVYLLEEQIKSGIEINRIAVENGIALKSSISLLEAENLKIEKRLIDLKFNRKAYVERLALFIGKHLTENTTFERPEETGFFSQINRPELALFDAQKEVYQTQQHLIDDQNLPSLSLFGQGGYGKPGLNMLSNQTDLFYLAGLRLSWNISGLYTHKKDKKQLEIKQEMVQIEQETFLFNIDQSLQIHQQEMDKLEALITADRQIIQRRKEISETAKAQLQNGVLTTNDYLNYLREEDEARQELLLHETKRLKALYDYKITSGN